jgi:hypothetical protein
VPALNRGVLTLAEGSDLVYPWWGRALEGESEGGMGGGGRGRQSGMGSGMGGGEEAGKRGGQGKGLGMAWGWFMAPNEWSEGVST